MSQTSVSLLQRVQSGSDADSWQRLTELYTPLIRGWLRRGGLLDHDADDLIQEVLAVVVRKLPEFRRAERPGAFRCWLRTISVNCLRAHWRARQGRPTVTGDTDFLQFLEQLEDPASGLSRQWDEEHDRHVFQRLLALVQPQFEPATWEAFRRVALDGQSPDDVAAGLGITVNAVFIAKSRVLRRLRDEGAGLID